MALNKTDYGLIYNDDGSLCVTIRKDDVPFLGVTSFAVEEGTTNLFSNPIFADGTFNGYNFLQNWTTKEIKDGGPFGKYAELYTANGLAGIGAWFDVNEGETYAFSVYVKVLEWDQRSDAQAEIVYFGANNTVLSYVFKKFVETPSTNRAKDWTRFDMALTVPAGATKARVGIWVGATTVKLQTTAFQFEQKPFATSFVDGTRPHGIVKLTNPPLPLDNFVINLWFKPTRYPTQNGRSWHLFNVSYNASAFQGLELVAPPSAQDGIPANTLSLTVRNSRTIFTRYNLRFDLSAEIGKWHMITLISNGNILDVYIDGEKRVSATNDIQRSAIEFIVFGRWFADISGSASARVNGFLMSNVLFASYDPAIWTDTYIQELYRARKPFAVPPRIPLV